MGIIFSCFKGHSSENSDISNSETDYCLRPELHMQSPTSDRSFEVVEPQSSSEPPVTMSVPSTTRIDDINFTMKSMKISTSYSKNHLLPKFNNNFYEDLLLPDERDECPTCLEEYDAENPKIITECSHHFHLSCIYDWMERSNTCPVCSKVMVFHEAT
ncbi:hypothetical protein RND81_07G176000 [Saponaria officinalis]|uniref:RING-type E3 ubiquitin transferase n=1 Tax=Saponaria officinalis TaxID=3572 RepID=A0AAW1JSH2_SAPOF